ncbi:MAG: class I SAM-dependent methyltransferase [Roseomonas sp.]
MVSSGVPSSITQFLEADISSWWPRHIDESAWLEHTPFAAWLMRSLRPTLFVELGAHRAVSYMAFCQAASLFADPPRCFAVDTWKGDAHSGSYSNAIFDQVKTFNKKYYSEFSVLIRSTFSEALTKFEDKSIDLLHIDGFHTYDAVSDDFNSWLPKMSNSGVILFHDIEVRERDFGVWRFWDEVTQRYPHFSFLHGHGLGVLAVGNIIPDGVKFLFEEADKRLYTKSLRERFSGLGACVSKIYESRVRAGQGTYSASTATGRALNSAQRRKDILLAGARKDWQILEIGPSHAPIADKKSGWNTTIVDHADKKGLIHKYENDRTVDTNFIEEVDFVWSGEKLEQLIPREKHGKFDIVIASHVIEHFPDPVGVLKSAETLLRSDTGLISLAVPDKRLCFDFFRPLSTTGQLLAAHRDGRMVHSAADRFDSVAYLAALQGDTSWGWRRTESVLPLYRLEEAYRHFLEAYGTNKHKYQDCHGWIFTPASFELLILELSALGVLDWHIQNILPQAGVEFIVHLGRGKAIFESDDALEARRAVLLKDIQRDLYQQACYYFDGVPWASEKSSMSLVKNAWRAVVPFTIRQKIAKIRGKV